MTRDIDIVVPVYNAPDDVRTCVASVLAHTSQRHRLTLIDDASPDPRIAALFAEIAARALPQLTLLRNAANLGFTGTANRGFEVSRNDVVLLNSDTIVAEGWLDALVRCADADASIGTITPF
ncbi:MAG: glycosyltransferase family 2 protein, partial [Burkholderiales bacterium]